MNTKKLPIGYDDYKEVVEGRFYYIDKTLFIKELIDNMAKVSLFTRPRRFGKSLNLSMLELEIAKEYKRHSYVLDGEMADSDRDRFLLLMNGKAEYKEWLEAIAFLSRCLAEYYNQKVIILIDEYDFYHGFILGILMNLDNYKITSNREAGDGRYDISMESADGLNAPVIIGFKIANRKPELEAKADEALKQIIDNRYDVPFVADGYDKCVHIGIGFYKKMCRVKAEVVTLC